MGYLWLPKFLLRQVIQGIPGDRNISNDFVFFGEDREKHDLALKRVMQRLSDSGLTLNVNKCELRISKISFFGVVFSEQGISPDPTKVKVVREFSRPQNVKDSRSFLGMTNYCARFIKDYADICNLLRKLTHKETAWCWNDKCETAFVTLKDRLCDETVISYYDPKKPV